MHVFRITREKSVEVWQKVLRCMLNTYLYMYIYIYMCVKCYSWSVIFHLFCRSAKCIYQLLLCIFIWLQGKGTEEKQLIYILTTRSEIDLIDIKEEFQKLYKVDLKKRIEVIHVSSFYVKRLPTLVIIW